MKYWITFDQEGRITSMQNGLEIPEALRGEAMEVEHHIDPRSAYVENGQIVILPAQPSPDHMFDYRRKSWVLDDAAVATRQRIAREAELRRTDWTQMPDHPMPSEQKAAWAAYRQALRDITAHPQWPHVEFPSPPQFEKDNKQ